ncbi:MAG: hypothetical protein IJR34_04950 [Bacteroidales bacterium]|nr:hypothetical protein [Bacteroidales bacterium]
MTNLSTNDFSKAYAPPTARLIAVATERFVMGSPVTNPGFPGVDVYEEEF